MQALKATNFELTTPQQHYDLLHSAAHGTAIVWERQSTAKQWLKLPENSPEIPHILSSQVGKKDSFISVNEFYGWRLIRLLKSLRACYVDIDNPKTTLQDALLALQEAGLPPPNVVIWSGRGLHLYWVHNPLHGKALPVWQRVQNSFVAALKNLGSDPAAKDCTRVLRLVGSIHAKSSQTVHGRILDEQPWNFHHLCNEVLGYREQKPQQKVKDISVARAERRVRISTGSIYDRWHLVYQDLLTIAEWHFLGGVPEGHRNEWLFLASVSLSWFANHNTLASEIKAQAKIWTPGLTDAEIGYAIKQPLERAQRALERKNEIAKGEDDPRYKFKRETLYERLQGIIPDELQQNLRAIISNSLSEQRKREQRNIKLTRAEYLSQNNKSSNKPWELEGISRATYYRRQRQQKTES